GESARRLPHPDLPAARPARDHVSARDHEHARHRPRDSDVRGPEFLGARAAARDPRVGVDDRLGAKLSGPVVDQYVSGSGDPQHRRSPQRDGRQSARSAGPSIPKGLMSMRRTTMRDEVTPMIPPRERDPYIAWRPPFPEPRFGRDDTALLVVDMQHLDAHRDGSMGRKVRDAGFAGDLAYYLDRLALIVPNIRRLQDGFRAAGAEVIHTRIRSMTHDGRDRSIS